MESTKKKYKSLLKLSILDLSTELIGFIVVLVVAIMSSSLIMWFDTLDSFKNILNIVLVLAMSYFLTRDMKYKYNYGTGKLELVGSLITDVFMILGMVGTACFAVYDIVVPSQPSDNLLFAIFVKAGNVAINTFFFIKQIKIRRMGNNNLIQASFVRCVGNVAFDIAAFLGVLFSYLFRNSKFAWYINPVLCLIFSVIFTVICIRHIKGCIPEMVDSTLPEDAQMQILKILAKYSKEYSGFNSISSRINGKSMCIDISLSFNNDTTYDRIEKLAESLRNDIGQLVENSVVQLIVASPNE